MHGGRGLREDRSARPTPVRHVRLPRLLVPQSGNTSCKLSRIVDIWVLTSNRKKHLYMCSYTRNTVLHYLELAFSALRSTAGLQRCRRNGRRFQLPEEQKSLVDQFVV